MNPPTIEVILVDAEDRPVGTCEKLAAHVEGLLHRAVSVFLFDADGRWLLQQRAEGKYHSGGLWSNAACTHPRAGESLEDAVRRAVREELGAEIDELRAAFPFLYRAAVGNGLVEHEFDHVFTARLAGAMSPQPGEVSAVRWCAADEVTRELAAQPATFTPWFRLLQPVVAEHRLQARGAAAGVARA